MKIIKSFLVCFLFASVAQAQLDSTFTYIYNCDSCGTFKTVSFAPIDLETEVDITSQVLSDTSISTLAEFSSVSLRKALSPSGVKNPDKKTKMNIYPNPAKTNFFVNIESEKNCQVTIQISDLLGREIVVIEKKLHKKMNVIEMQTDKLISGNYIIRIFTNSEVFVRKLSVRKQ